jgi:Ca-activated chloride channel homolog
MHQFNPVRTLVLTLPLLLAACGNVPQKTVPTDVAAKTATVNGVRVIDASTYQLGVSALDNAQAIVRTATLSAPSVTGLSAGQATAQVCGQIQSQDVLTTAIALDSTGSMADTDPGMLREQAAKAFVGRMAGGDRTAVLSFDSGTAPTAGLAVAHLWQDFTGDQSLLTAGIEHASFVGGGTPLYDAVLDASTLASRATGTNRSVLVLTDGADSASSHSPTDVIAAAKANGTRVFAVGLDSANTLDFSDLERIVSETGGLFQKASDAAQLTSYFDHVYNAVSAQGCVQLNFTVPPAPGATVSGTLAFTASVIGKVDAPLSVPFTFTAR